MRAPIVSIVTQRKILEYLISCHGAGGREGRYREWGSGDGPNKGEGKEAVPEHVQIRHLGLSSGFHLHILLVPHMS